MMMKTVQLTAAGSIMLLAGVACTVGTDGTETGEFELVNTELDSGTPASFVDVDGQTWVLTKDSVDYQKDDGREPDGSEEHVSPLDMSFEDAVEAIRPYSLVGNAEYTLSDEDAKKFATKILAVMADEGTREALGAMGDDQAVEGGGAEETLPGVRQPKAAIWGGESRTDIDHLRDTYPYMTAGRMHSAGNCTAFKLINHHTAVTAAHCVHTGSSWKDRKQIKFGTNSSVGPNCYGMTTPGCWDGDDISCDYAVIQLRGRNGAQCTPSDYDVGYLGYQTVSGGTSSINAYHLGFPTEDAYKPAGWPDGLLSYEYRTDSWVPTLNYNRFHSYFDSAGGQSGGPYISYYGGTDHRARGIHKGTNSSNSRGRAFKSSLIDWFEDNDGY